MAIDPQSLLLRLNPVRPISLAPLAQLGGGGEKSMERERLRLMREKFEETKRRNKEEEALAKIQETGRTTREKMQADEAARKQAADQRAALMQRRQEAVGEFGKLNASGDIEGARGMVPMMTSLGVDVELEGEEAGLPRYRIDADPEATKAAATQRSMDGADIATEASDIGYPSDDSGVLDDTPGIPTTEEAFMKAQGASKFHELVGQPLRAASAPDYTGAVPKNVIDVGAMQAQTLARLNPMLNGAIGAYPEPYRESARRTAETARSSGLPANKAMEQFDKLRGGPDSLIRSDMEAQAAQGRFNQSQEAAAGRERSDQYNRGFTTMGKEIASKYNIQKLPLELEATDRVIKILSNEKDSDDSLAYAFISRSIAGERGATTEGDIKRATGMESQAWIDQIGSFFEKGLEGGLPLAQKNAILGVLKAMKETDEKRYADFANEVEDLASGHKDKEIAQGLRDYARVTVPKTVREKLAAERAAKSGGTTASAESSDPDFDSALESQAKEAGLDPAKIRGIISKESGGDPSAKNPNSSATGILQFTDAIAKSLGTTTDALSKMSATEQLPFVMKYLTSRGVTADHDQGDYYVATAAPAFLGKPDDTAVYKKGTPEYDKNPSWDIDGDGVVTVGDLKKWGGGKRGNASEDKEAEARALLESYGY